MIRIKLNDKHICTSEISLGKFLNTLDEERGVFAIILNSDFISKNKYDKIELKDGDKIDIVEPMQGG